MLNQENQVFLKLPVSHGFWGLPDKFLCCSGCAEVGLKQGEVTLLLILLSPVKEETRVRASLVFISVAGRCTASFKHSHFL